MATRPTTGHDEFLINFQSALTDLGDNIAIIDRQYRIIFQNTMCRKIHSLQIGRLCHTGFRNQDTACPDCPAQKVFQGEGISQSEQILTDRDKNEQWLELIVSPLTDTKGETKAAIIVQRDVTARKRKNMEKELLIRQLQRGMVEVRKPNGIVTICMFCKKTHDESDKKWTVIETLLLHRLNIQLSHGLCPDCGQKHYPEFTT